MRRQSEAATALLVRVGSDFDSLRRDSQDDPRRHTKQNQIVFVRFRVISRIVLVRAGNKHETKLHYLDATLLAETEQPTAES